MSIPRFVPRSRRLRQLTGAAALAVSGMLGGAYLAIRYRSASLRQEPLKPEQAVTEIVSNAVVKPEQNPRLFELQTPQETFVVQDPVLEPSAIATLDGHTVGELYALAKTHDIPGRSGMRKAQLIAALQERGVTSA